jgi:hypothetical protein
MWSWILELEDAYVFIFVAGTRIEIRIFKYQLSMNKLECTCLYSTTSSL